MTHEPFVAEVGNPHWRPQPGSVTITESRTRMITHIRATADGALVVRLASQHTPNTPRTHDAHGRPVYEPPQCVRCLQSWPCDIRQLLDIVLAPA